ncbi:hypothetical protein SAMN02745702_01327 [Desulfobaculum bizertense DSM 18034]|uniref:Uncharacterized protein n=1 Tax=Desulfobaculum bizertense DSM 18034 TaxID=1121442 RepID=A0A1T4VZ75_9BACT|nr:hypothetical protein SAMN02745702_01327 [Desulfobaculum bizertense DSM 18034]
MASSFITKFFRQRDAQHLSTKAVPNQPFRNAFRAALRRTGCPSAAARKANGRPLFCDPKEFIS